MSQHVDSKPSVPSTGPRVPTADESVSLARVYLSFHAANTWWLLRLEDSGEVLPVPDIERVPLTQSWFLGAANVRGVIYGVSDFAAFVASEPSPRGPENRLLLIGQRFALNVALLVARVGSLRGRAELKPAETGARLPWARAAWRDARGALCQELDAAGLVQRDDFLDVALVETSRRATAGAWSAS